MNALTLCALNLAIYAAYSTRLRCDVKDSYCNCLPCKRSPQIVFVAIVVVAIPTAIAAALKSPIIQPVKNVLIKVIQQRFHHYTTVTD